MASLKPVEETEEEEGVVPGLRRTGLLQWDSDEECTASPCSARAGTFSSRDISPDRGLASDLAAVLHEIQENQGQLVENFKNLRAYHQREHSEIMEALQEQQYRCEQVEEQLSDLMELHQNDIWNLTEELNRMEEKIASQSYKKALSFHEALEACQTRLFKMEQQTQVLQHEGSEVTAWSLLGKPINVPLVIMAVLLAFVFSAANCGYTLLTLFFVVIVWRYWDVILEYAQYILYSTLWKGTQIK